MSNEPCNTIQKQADADAATGNYGYQYKVVKKGDTLLLSIHSPNTDLAMLYSQSKVSKADDLYSGS